MVLKKSQHKNRSQSKKDQLSHNLLRIILSQCLFQTLKTNTWTWTSSMTFLIWRGTLSIKILRWNPTKCWEISKSLERMRGINIRIKLKKYKSKKLLNKRFNIPRKNCSMRKDSLNSCKSKHMIGNKVPKWISSLITTTVRNIHSMIRINSLTVWLIPNTIILHITLNKVSSKYLLNLYQG